MIQWSVNLIFEALEQEQYYIMISEKEWLPCIVVFAMSTVHIIMYKKYYFEKGVF